MKKDAYSVNISDIGEGDNFICVFIKDNDDYVFIKNKSDVYLPVLIHTDGFNNVEDNIIKVKKHFIKWFGIEPNIGCVSQNCYSLYPILDVKFFPMVCNFETEDEGKNIKWYNNTCTLEKVNAGNMEMWRNNNYFFDTFLREMVKVN